MILISEKEKFFDPRKPFASKRPETHEEWQARMGGEVLAVVRSGLYLDFRFLDMALSALTPVPDERCGVLATDGVNLYYQPSALLRLYQENPKYLNRLYLHTVFHCVFRHLWLKGKRDARLWNLACDIAVENVLDSLNRSSVKRPLTWVRQNAYAAIAAEGRVVAAAPAYRWLAGQTPGILRQLEREFYTDDHRLWPKDAPEQPQQMPTPLPQKTWQKIGERMQTELDLRDKEAGDGADALKQQVKAANRSRRSYQDFLRRFCVTREEVHLDPDEFDLNFYTYGLSVYGNMPLIEPLAARESKKIEVLAAYEPSFRFMAEWWKQLYGESEGKEHKGLFPASVEFTADLHSMGQYIQQGARTLLETVVRFAADPDQLTVPHDDVNGDGLNFLEDKTMDFINRQAMDGTLLAHVEGGVPNLIVSVGERNARTLGELIYFFEFSCGLSGYLLGVNPFDQPGVEAYKKNMFALLGKPGYEEAGEDLRAKLSK